MTPRPLAAAELAAELTRTVTDTVTSGSLLLALPIAALAGLLSFLSPCVLPLVPGYLSYVTGMSGVELAKAQAATALPGTVRTADRCRTHPALRVVAGTGLFVLGFSAVFISAGVLFGALGAFVLAHTRAIQVGLGVLTVLLGLAFAGLLPWMSREWRIYHTPALGLAGAPALGVLFGLGWTPCIGPTLGAVLALAFSDGGATRGGILAGAYCLGLGVPFLVTGLAYRRALGAMGWARRHTLWLMRAGGAMLVVLGVLLVTGTWQQLSVRLQVLIANFTTPL